MCGLSSFYLSEGFIQLENVMEKAIIEWKTGKAVEMNVEVRVSWHLVTHMPYSAF